MQTSSPPIKLVVNFSPDHSEYLAFPIGKITIGRSLSNNIIFTSEYISRIHAVIYVDWFGKLRIRDGALFGKRSSHGLYLDDCRIFNSEIEQGETIKFSSQYQYPNIDIIEITKINGDAETQNFPPEDISISIN